jgi:hypothetical protein
VRYESHFVYRQKLLGEDGSVRRGDVFARFHAVAAKRRSRTWNSQFGLKAPMLRATTTAEYMAAPARNILETTSYISTETLCMCGTPITKLASEINIQSLSLGVHVNDAQIHGIHAVT